MGNRYSYEDYPDGTNCVYKTAVVTKYTSGIAFLLATADVVQVTKPGTIGGALVRYPQYMVPGVFSGVAFGMTACTLTMMRKKDDNWNYFFAGGAMGSVFGLSRRSFAVGVPSAVVLAIFGVFYKEYTKSESHRSPKPVNWNGTWDSMVADYTLTPERPPYTLDRPSFK